MNRQSTLSSSPDERIDAALRIVSDCRVPPGLEERVQQRLRSAADTKSPGVLRSVRVPAAAGAAAAILITILLSLHSRPAEHLDVAHSSTSAAIQTASNRSTALVQPVHVQEWENGHVLKTVRHHSKTVVQHHAARLFDYPLTKQERLLVRFARTASPAELQFLNPQYQAKVEAQQEAEFAAYIHSADESGAKETQVAANPQTTQE